MSFFSACLKVHLFSSHTLYNLWTFLFLFVNIFPTYYVRLNVICFDVILLLIFIKVHKQIKVNIKITFPVKYAQIKRLIRLEMYILASNFKKNIISTYLKLEI